MFQNCSGKCLHLKKIVILKHVFLNKWKTVIQNNSEGQGENVDLPYDT